MTKQIDDQTKAVLENIKQTEPKLLQPLAKPHFDLFADARAMSDEIVRKYFEDIIPPA